VWDTAYRRHNGAQLQLRSNFGVKGPAERALALLNGLEIEHVVRQVGGNGVDFNLEVDTVVHQASYAVEDHDCGHRSAEVAERAPHVCKRIVHDLDGHLRHGFGQHLFKDALLQQRDDDDDAARVLVGACVESQPHVGHARDGEHFAAVEQQGTEKWGG